VIRYFFSASNFHRLPFASLLALSGAIAFPPYYVLFIST